MQPARQTSGFTSSVLFSEKYYTHLTQGYTRLKSGRQEYKSSQRPFVRFYFPIRLVMTSRQVEFYRLVCFEL